MRTRTLFTVLAACLAAAPPASATWSPPFDLSVPDGLAGKHQIAADPSGAATVVWEAFDGTHTRVQARRIDPGASTGPILEVSEAGEDAQDPRVGVDATGNAIVVWNAEDGADWLVRSRRISPAGAMEDIRDLTSPSPAEPDPRIAVARDGSATLVWDGGISFLQVRRIDAAGTLGPVLDLSVPGHAVTDYEVAADPTGRAFVVWNADDGSDVRVHGRQMSPAGTLGAIADLSAAGVDAFSPQVGVDDAGVPTAVWRRSDGIVQARQGLSGGGLGAIMDVSPTGEVGTDPQLALDPAGNAFVMWGRVDAANETVHLRRIATGAVLEEIKDLSAGDNDSFPELSVDASGTATAAWMHDDGSARVIQARTAAPDGSLGPTADVSSTAVGEQALLPELASGPAGETTAVWARFDGVTSVIKAARYPEPPPPPPPPPPNAPAAPHTPAVTTPTSCPSVALKKLSSYTAGQPKSKRKRTKGIGTKLTLSRAGRLQLLSATLSYRLDGKARSAKLRTKQLSTSGTQPKLRFKLPGRLAGKLVLGKRVTLKLKLRARSGAAGCSFGRAKTLKLTTKVIWVSKRSAI
jgi:hypothetical protein